MLLFASDALNEPGASFRTGSPTGAGAGAWPLAARASVGAGIGGFCPFSGGGGRFQPPGFPRGMGGGGALSMGLLKAAMRSRRERRLGSGTSASDEAGARGSDEVGA